MTGSPARWLDVGHSRHSDASTAGRDAVRGAVGDRTDARLLILFASDAHDLDALLAGATAAGGDVPLVGCSTAGEIGTAGPGDAGAVCVALGGPGFSVATAVAHDASSDLRGAGAHVARAMAGLEDHPHRVLMLLTDGLSGDQQEIVRGAHGVLGSSVPLVGGCAGDDLKMVRTHQFHGDQALTNAVIGVGIASHGPMGIGVRHGWRRVDEPMLVTGSEGNRVLTLDDRPALDVYLERLGAPAAAHTDPAAFTRFALTHPLGLDRRGDEDHVRFIGEADFAQRSLVCIAEVPQGGLAWFMQGDAQSVLAATESACADALAALGSQPPLGLLAFNCIARRGILGDGGIRREVEVIGRAAGVPVAGFYTYGEIARTRGVSGFHNQTLVVLAVA